LNHTPIPHVNSLPSKLIDGKAPPPRTYFGPWTFVL
jgi:hypothetical protein